MKEAKTSRKGDEAKKEDTSSPYLLIRNGSIIGRFRSFYDAYQEGLHQFSQQDFMVKKMEEE